MDRVGFVRLVFCSVLFTQCSCIWLDSDYFEPEELPVQIPEESTEETELYLEYDFTGKTNNDDTGSSVVINQNPSTTEYTYVENISENEIQHEPSEKTVAIPKNPENPEFNLLIKNLTSRVSNLTTELLKQQSQIADLEKTNKRLQEKVEFIEQQTKTNSLIFFNVPEIGHETYKTTLTRVLYVVNKVMRVKTRADEIAVALRTDSEDGATYRPIMVKFVKFETKMKVLAAKPRLQQSLITVEPDYSEGVATERAQLVPYMMAARARGAHVYMLYNRLVIDGVKFSLQELKTQDPVVNLS